MEVKVYASKKMLVLVGAVCMLIAVVCCYFGFGVRIADATHSKDYEYYSAEVKDVYEHDHEDSDGDKYYTYSALLELQLNRTTVAFETGDIFDREPENGERIPVMCKDKGDAEYDYYVAKQDWMTKAYVPYDRSYESYVFAALVCMAFGLMVFGFMLPAGKAQGSFLGIGLLLIGIGGIYLAFAAKVFGALLLVIFGAVGVLVLHRTFFVSKEKQQEMVEQNQYEKLLVVRDVLYQDANGTETVVFAMIGSEAQDMEYFSYDTVQSGRFLVGSRCSADSRKLMGCSERRQIGQYDTINVSVLPVEEFKELSAVAKKTFEIINALYEKKTGNPFV